MSSSGSSSAMLSVMQGALSGTEMVIVASCILHVSLSDSVFLLKDNNMVVLPASGDQYRHGKRRIDCKCTYMY